MNEEESQKVPTTWEGGLRTVHSQLGLFEEKAFIPKKLL